MNIEDKVICIEDKVICIENKKRDGNLHPHLTLNKVYNVKIEDTVYIINGVVKDKDTVYIISDLEGKLLVMDENYYKRFFVTLQKHRENQLNMIGI
jgi:hypothetical protein